MSDEYITKSLGQVSEQVERMSILVGSLLEIVGNLENRLSTVLPKSISQSIEDKKEPEMLVPLAGDLRNFNDKLTAVGVRLNDILSRCEL